MAHAHPAYMNAHEICIFRCVVWTESICETVVTRHLDWNCFFFVLFLFFSEKKKKKSIVNWVWSLFRCCHVLPISSQNILCTFTCTYPDIHILIASWCPLKDGTSEIRHTSHVLFILAWLFNVHLQHKGRALLCPAYSYIINNIEMLSERKRTSNWTPRCLQITVDWIKKTHSFETKYIIYLMWISGSECCAWGPAASLEKLSVVCINVVICYYR